MLGTRWAALAAVSGPAGDGHQEPLARNAAVQVGTARGRISELQAFQHSLNPTNGGGASATAAQKVAAAAATPPPFPTARRRRRRRRGGGGCGCHQEQGTPGSAFGLDAQRRPRRWWPRLRPSSVVVEAGRRPRGHSGDCRALATSPRRCRGVPTVAAGTAAIAAANANAIVSDGAAKQDGDEAALAAMPAGWRTEVPAPPPWLRFPPLRRSGGVTDCVDVRSSAAMTPSPSPVLEGADGDVIEATSHPLDLDRVMASVRASRVPSWPVHFVRFFGRWVPHWRSLAQHGALVEAALRPQHDPQVNVIRVALVVVSVPSRTAR